jgi:hypothetical protein
VNHVSYHAMHWEAIPHQNQGIQFREIKIQNSTFEEKKVSPLALIQASRKG